METTGRDEARPIKKKHLSQIVFQRILMMFIGSFVILMATTIVYFLLYGKHKIEEEMEY